MLLGSRVRKWKGFGWPPGQPVSRPSFCYADADLGNYLNLCRPQFSSLLNIGSKKGMSTWFFFSSVLIPESCHYKANDLKQWTSLVSSFWRQSFLNLDVHRAILSDGSQGQSFLPILAPRDCWHFLVFESLQLNDSSVISSFSLCVFTL